MQRLQTDKPFYRLLCLAKLDMLHSEEWAQCKQFLLGHLRIYMQAVDNYDIKRAVRLHDIVLVKQWLCYPVVMWRCNSCRQWYKRRGVASSRPFACVALACNGAVLPGVLR